MFVAAVAETVERCVGEGGRRWVDRLVHWTTFLGRRLLHRGEALGDEIFAAGVAGLCLGIVDEFLLELVFAGAVDLVVDAELAGREGRWRDGRLRPGR